MLRLFQYNISTTKATESFMPNVSNLSNFQNRWFVFTFTWKISCMRSRLKHVSGNQYWTLHISISRITSRLITCFRMLQIHQRIQSFHWTPIFDSKGLHPALKYALQLDTIHHETANVAEHCTYSQFHICNLFRLSTQKPDHTTNHCTWRLTALHLDYKHVPNFSPLNKNVPNSQCNTHLNLQIHIDRRQVSKCYTFYPKSWSLTKCCTMLTTKNRM